MKKFVALLLAVLMVASLCACGQKDTQTGSDIKTVTAGKLTMSTNAQFPPYESVADDDKGYEGTGFEGIDIEIAYALAQKLGLELVVDDMDFDSALSAVQTGKSDIVAAGVTVTPERQNTMCFTDSYANGVQVVIVKEGSDIKSIDDLEGKQIRHHVQYADCQPEDYAQRQPYDGKADGEDNAYTHRHKSLTTEIMVHAVLHIAENLENNAPVFRGHQTPESGDEAVIINHNENHIEQNHKPVEYIHFYILAHSQNEIS